MDNAVDITNELIIPYINGHNLNAVTIYLRTQSDFYDKNAFDFFKQKVSDEIKAQVLRELEAKIDLGDYCLWLKSLNLEDSLFYFLEYLSLQGYHRFRYLLKQVQLIKSPPKYHRLCIAAMAMIGCAGIYFSLNQAAWLVFLNWIKVSIPSFVLKLVDWILIPQNLSLFMITYQLGKYLSECYLILANHATSKAHKIQKLCHSTLNFLLITIAHSIIFFNLSMAYISGVCFMLSSLVDLCWSLVLRHQMLKSPPLSLEDLETMRLPIYDKIRGLEQHIFFKRKTKQLYIEGISLFITFITSCISIYFSPHIACVAALCACFQFLMNVTKSYYYNTIERDFCAELQTTIANLYKHESPSARIDMASPLLT